MFLGVDGGASKTLAVLVDAQGRELGRGAAGCGNHTAVGAERAAANVRMAIAAAMAQAGAQLPITAAWLGLAGVQRAAGRARMQPDLEGVAEALRLTSDAELVLAGLEQGCGVALIAGTGSFALGRDATGNTTHAGGWGYLMGDEGGGYDLGRKALQAATRASDGRGPQTVLLPMILAFWGLTQPDELVAQVYSIGDAASIAALAPVVLAAATADAVAGRLVRHAANELGLSVLRVAARLALPNDTLPLAFAGGLLVGNSDYRALVLERVRRRRQLGATVLVAEPALSAARAVAQAYRHGTILASSW